MASKPNKEKDKKEKEKEKDRKGKKPTSLARSSGADAIGEVHHGDDRSEASSSNDDRINKILPQHHASSYLTSQPTASLPAEVCFIQCVFSCCFRVSYLFYVNFIY